MKKLFFTSVLMVLIGTMSYTQQIVALYEGKAPGSEEWNYKEIAFTHARLAGQMIRNVVDPSLTVYLPEKSLATGTAVIICPGGGNVWLSYSSEGTEVAEWLVKKGVAAFVLKYRLNKTPESEEDFDRFLENFYSRMTAPPDTENTTTSTQPAANTNNNARYYAGEDGIRAMQYVRAHAGEYGIDPEKVGIMGFSAGASVTMHVVLNSDTDKLPDFAAPIYGGRIGESQIPENAPPLFILCAADDPVGAGSPDLYKSWRAAGHSAELHIYSRGGHGFGMSQRGLPVNNWIERFYEWLKVTGF